MKKIVSVLIMTMLAAVMLTACSEKPVTVADIKGTWVNTVEGSVVTSTFVYTFKEDMTYTDSMTSGSDVAEMGGDFEGKYSLSGNTLTIDDGFGTNSYTVKFKNGNMIWVTDAGKERVWVRK